MTVCVILHSQPGRILTFKDARAEMSKDGLSVFRESAGIRSDLGFFSKTDLAGWWCE